MKERPIIFDAESVRAILAGRKTMTRRVIKPQPEWDAEVHVARLTGHYLFPIGELGQQCGMPLVTLRFGVPGDRLWVREAWGITSRVPLDAHRTYMEIGKWMPDVMSYRADALLGGWEWKSPLFMPRWASRITLEVTDVRAERLTDISYQDVEAEGITPPDWDRYEAGAHEVLIERFAERWDALNAKRAPWDSNCWVWVVSFRKVQP